VHITQVSDEDLKPNGDEDRDKVLEPKTPKRVGWKLLGDQRGAGRGGTHEPDVLRLESAATKSSLPVTASSSSMRPESSLKKTPSHSDKHRTPSSEDHASDKRATDK
jgi:hypothetical protein